MDFVNIENGLYNKVDPDICASKIGRGLDILVQKWWFHFLILIGL